MCSKLHSSCSASSIVLYGRRLSSSYLHISPFSLMVFQHLSPLAHLGTTGSFCSSGSAEGRQYNITGSCYHSHLGSGVIEVHRLCQWQMGCDRAMIVAKPAAIVSFKRGGSVRKVRVVRKLGRYCTAEADHFQRQQCV